jgi:hypothetical protein
MMVHPSGAPIRGAIVELGHPDQTREAQTTTDEYGQFAWRQANTG